MSAALRPDTVLVSLMHVNNETGVIQDVAAIGAITRQQGVLLHVDAAQSAGKLPLDLQTLPVDLLSLSAHKLMVERHWCALRSPESAAGAARTAAAPAAVRSVVCAPVHYRLIKLWRWAKRAVSPLRAWRLSKPCIWVLRDQLCQGLTALDEVELNGHPDCNVAGILNLSFAGISAEALLAALPEIAVATGSACTSASHEPSHVLRAMGGQ